MFYFNMGIKSDEQGHIYLLNSAEYKNEVDYRIIQFSSFILNKWQ